MELASIGTTEMAPELRAALNLELEDLDREGLTWGLKEVSAGGMTVLTLEVADISGDARQGLLAKIVRTLSTFVVQRLQPALLARLVKRNYGYFDGQEQGTIVQQAEEDLSDSRQAPIHSQEQVRERLEHYFDDEDFLNLDGFITFRLRDYLDGLETAIDQAVDDYLVEREYREFVRLLRYFVEAQEPRLAKAHVLIEGPRTFRIFDQSMRPVENQALQEFVVEMVDSEVSYEDLLVSALITVAPAQVVLHGETQLLGRDSLRTVESVFTDRLTLCRGCSFCHNLGVGKR